MRGTPFGFSGFHMGLNTIDSPFTLVEGETRECLNVVSSERGAIKKRTGSVLFAPGTSGAFPVLAATDTFKRAAEKPLSNGAKWTLIPSFENTGEIGAGEHWQRTAGTSSGAFWNEAEQTNPAANVELQTAGTTPSVSTAVWACVQSGESQNGYQFAIFFTKEGKYTPVLYRFKEGVRTPLAETVGVPFEAGQSICISVRGGVVSCWRKSASVTTKLLEAKDTTFTKGFSGFSSLDQTVRLNNFATGEMPAFTELEFTSLAPVKTAGGTFLIAASGKKLYSINSEGEGNEIGEGFTEGKQWSIIQAWKTINEAGQGPVYLTNGTDPPQEWTGAEAKTKVKEWKSKSGEIAEFKEEFVATPKAKFLTTHLGRVFAANIGGGTSAEKSWVRWTRLNLKQESDPSLWPKLNFIEFDADDGYEITGLATVGPYVLVFKPYKCWVIHNPNVVNGFRQLSENTGCASQRSIVETPSGTYFLSVDQGVYLTNGSRLTEVSYKVRPTLLAINQANREKAAGAFFNNHYYLSIPSGTSTTPNRTLDYDVALKSWWIHDIAGNQWAEWEPVNPGEPFLFTAPAKAKGGVVKAFIPGVFTDAGANYTGENGLGAFWVSPWEPFFYFIFRHRIKAPFIKKRIREFFFDGSGEVIPFQYRNFNAGRETLACVVNNNEMAKPELPVKLTGSETEVWGGSGTWANGGVWGGVPTAARARAYSLGVGNEWSFGFGNNSAEPFEITMVAYMAQFRKS